MAKKGIVASAVRAAVAAAEKAIAPSPLAKPEILAPLEKTLQRNAADLAKPIDKALSRQPREGSQRKRQKRKFPRTSSRTKGSARKTAASRKKKKPSRVRAAASRKMTARTGARKKARKST